MSELQRFFDAWDFEAQNTTKLLRSLPEGKYDFRPWPDGRSLGELAWHLSEVDAYMSHGITENSFQLGSKPPGLERPRQIAELAPGYERVHKESVARLKKISDADLDRTIPFFDGRPLPVRQIMWSATLHHLIHHRGQLMLMSRLAGGTPPGMYGPNREDSLKMAEAMKARG